MTLKLQIETREYGIVVSFIDVSVGPDHVVAHAQGNTLAEAIERSITCFKTMQDAALAELKRWNLIGGQAVIVRTEEPS